MNGALQLRICPAEEKHVGDVSLRAATQPNPPNHTIAPPFKMNTAAEVVSLTTICRRLV
jgi:hypothetical protein